MEFDELSIKGSVLRITDSVISSASIGCPFHKGVTS